MARKGKTMADSKSAIDHELIRELARLLDETGLTEIEIEREGLRVPVIFISAFASARTRERVEASPALCLIEKPIDAAELETWIGRALGRA